MNRLLFIMISKSQKGSFLLKPIQMHHFDLKIVQICADKSCFIHTDSNESFIIYNDFKNTKRFIFAQTNPNASLWFENRLIMRKLFIFYPIYSNKKFIIYNYFKNKKRFIFS